MTLFGWFSNTFLCFIYSQTLLVWLCIYARILCILLIYSVVKSKYISLVFRLRLIAWYLQWVVPMYSSWFTCSVAGWCTTPKTMLGLHMGPMQQYKLCKITCIFVKYTHYRLTAYSLNRFVTPTFTKNSFDKKYRIYVELFSRTYTFKNG